MSKLQFDVLFIDTTTPFPYEHSTLRTRGIGGTEASVIRVAEGLAALGAKVGVIVHNLPDILMGPNAYYLPLSMIDDVETQHYVMLRGTQFAEKFPRAKKYSWHQDVADQRTYSLRESFLKHDVKVIGVSKWHKNNLQEILVDRNSMTNPWITYIYNPLDESIMIPKNVEIKYNPNKLVWPASPHKGLKEAVALMERVVEFSGNKDFRLHTFNPGYFGVEEIRAPFLINHGPVPCHELWQHVSESLCVFYPTTFKETFGCIAAEANAVHTPVLTNEVAALAETVSSPRQFVPKNSIKAVVDTVLHWHAGYRPKVWGNEQFRLSNVLQRWVKLFATGYID